MKISLLSVAPPYRGGISEQTYHLYSQLKNSHSVNIVNFKRQYPKFLFPGKTQYRNTPLKNQDKNHRIVDSINPFSWIKAVKFIKKSSPDLIIIRFWNPFFALCHSYIIRKVKKQLKNTKVVCICDNIIPHEKHFYDIPLIKKLFKHIDAYIVMSIKVEEELRDIVSNPIYKKMFHPIVAEANMPSQEVSKAKMGLTGKKVILFFGLIRQYKGLDVLIRANKYLKEKLSGYQILICGESYQDENKYNKLIKENSKNNEIRWINQYIPDSEVSTYFSASDVVVLPYKNASQSGIIPLSYSYKRPVIASDIKGIQEMIIDQETGFLFEKNNSEALSESIIDFFSNKKNYNENIIDFRKQFSWNYFIEGVLDLYKCL